MKKTAFVSALILIFVSTSATFGKNIPNHKLREYGISAFQQRSHQSNQLKRIDYLLEENDTVMAVFNFENGGFLILSTDDAFIPVIGYSLENSFSTDNMAPAMSAWLQAYKEDILYTKKNQITANERISTLWAEIISASPKSNSRSIIVSPLLKSTWNQNQYYNTLCPEDDNSPEGYDGHVPNGCVALAMASVIHYYRYPDFGQGSHSYHSNYGTHSVNYSQQHYCYEAMPYSLSNYNNEVAKLIYHCGISVNMGYAADGSGAQTENTAPALQNYYQYDSDISTASRAQYNSESWKNLLISNLDAKHPIIYSGYSDEGGHAFVCDGYDSDNNFHFNWGWGGYGNGYFTIQGNNEDAVGGYSSWQGIVHSIYPPESAYPDYCPQNNPITALSGIVEDGSGIYNYQNNTNCTYIIAPEDATVISMSLIEINTEAGIDTLSVWDGDPANGGTHLATFSGTTCNPDNWILSRSGMMYLVFKTNGNTTGAGWRLTFMAQRSVICVGTTRHTEASGTFNDGSEDSEYASNANCIWRIEPEGASYVNLSFDQFDISPEDNIYIYDAHALNANLLATYTGSTIPNSIHSTTGKIKVVFKSDNYLQRAGFSAHWNSDGTGIEEYLPTQAFEIFPTPTSDRVFINLPTDFQKGVIRIFEMSGKEIISQEYSTNNSIYQVDVQHIPAGIYLLSISNKKELLSKKLIIQR